MRLTPQNRVSEKARTVPQLCRSGPCSFGITSSLTLLCLGFSLAALPTMSRANGKEQVQRVKSEEGTDIKRKKSST